MVDETSYASDVADGLELTSLAYAEDVTGAVDLTSAAYGEDVAEAINEQPVDPPEPPVSEPDLRVCQYNIGHFAMGASTNSGANPAWRDDTSDGYPSSLSRNYSIQLQRWKNCISGIGADIFGLPEYSARFGRHDGADVALEDTGIFDGYEHFSVGKTAGGGYWINTIISKYALSNAQDIDLGSTVSNKAYVRVTTITLKGKTVKVAVTHLNWNQSQAYYDSRQVEIKNLVKLFQNEPYVILCGDFNTRPMSGDEVNGLHDFDPFIYGFTEDGETYHGGYTLANNLNNPLATCYATNSRPDVSDPKVPFVYLDNICTKGFAMSNITLIDDGTLTDHCAVWCDLTLID